MKLKEGEHLQKLHHPNASDIDEACQVCKGHHENSHDVQGLVLVLVEVQIICFFEWLEKILAFGQLVLPFKNVVIELQLAIENS